MEKIKLTDTDLIILEAFVKYVESGEYNAWWLEGALKNFTEAIDANFLKEKES